MITESFIYHSENPDVKVQEPNVICPFCKQKLTARNTKEASSCIIFVCSVKNHSEYAEFEAIYDVQENASGIDLALISTIFMDFDKYRVAIDFVIHPDEPIFSHSYTTITVLDPDYSNMEGLRRIVRDYDEIMEDIAWDFSDIESFKKQFYTLLAFS